MDRDNNGSISRHELDCEEFHTVIRAVLLPQLQATAGMGGPGYGRAEMDMDQAIQFLMRKADLNHDNKISFEEFKAFVLILRQPQIAMHTANLIFALFDVDRNQFVDEAEFRQIYRFYLGHVPTEVEFQAEWARLDSMNAGKVSRDDYVLWLQTSSNEIFRQHAPQPEAMVMSGTADYHEFKRFTVMTPEIRGQLQTCPSASSQPVPGWRPWHNYSNMAWAQVRQGKTQTMVNEAKPSQIIERPPSEGRGLVNSRSKKERNYLPHGVPSRLDPISGSLAVAALPSRISRSAPSRQSRSAGCLPVSERDTKWNHRLATANMNWPDSGGNPRRCRGMRSFMSTPQSTSELSAHYSENPGFEDNLRSLQMPNMTFTSKYSNDLLTVRTAPESLPNRSKFKQGRCRNPKTGKREYWEDNLGKACILIREKYVSGTNSLRSPGQPPRYMYVDEYEDPPVVDESL